MWDILNLYQISGPPQKNGQFCCQGGGSHGGGVIGAPNPESQMLRMGSLLGPIQQKGCVLFKTRSPFPLISCLIAGP